jgi:hypothetical protein
MGHKYARRATVVLHEVAHWVAVFDGHGEEFRFAFAALIREFIGRAAAETFLAQCKQQPLRAAASQRPRRKWQIRVRDYSGRRTLLENTPSPEAKKIAAAMLKPGEILGYTSRGKDTEYFAIPERDPIESDGPVRTEDRAIMRRGAWICRETPTGPIEIFMRLGAV